MTCGKKDGGVFEEPGESAGGRKEHQGERQRAEGYPKGFTAKRVKRRNSIYQGRWNLSKELAERKTGGGGGGWFVSGSGQNGEVKKHTSWAGGGIRGGVLFKA